MCISGPCVTKFKVTIYTQWEAVGPPNADSRRWHPQCLRGRHGPREAPVESAAEAPMNGKNGTQPPLQLKLMTLLLLYDHNTNT